LKPSPWGEGLGEGEPFLICADLCKSVAFLPDSRTQSNWACRAILSASAPPKGEAIAAEAGQTKVRLERVSPHRQIMCKYFAMNNLQLKSSRSRSKSIKVNQSDSMLVWVPFGDVRACLKTHTRRRVRARGLQEMAISPIFCRPGPLTGRVFKQALKNCQMRPDGV
jgi:hypothetical protein